MESKCTILVIDDSESYCKVTKRWLAKACGCEVAYACTPNDAELVLSSNPVKVITFDWDMPIMNGTDLYYKLRKIDNRFKSVLLSGEAPKEIFSDPTNIWDARILKNSDDGLLPNIILHLIASYNQTLIGECSHVPFFSEKIGRLFPKHKISYFISDVQVLDDKYVDPNSFVVLDETKDIIRAGESKEIDIKDSITKVLSVSDTHKQTSSQKLSAKLGLSDLISLDFDASFASEIDRMLQSTITQTRNHEQTKKWTRALPADGDIQYERLETAKVFMKVRVFITTSFSWSTQKYIDCYDLTLPTRVITSRFYQCKKNGDGQYIDAGMYTVL